MAGIVHFSNFFRYMESAEHAFFRSLGHSVTLSDIDDALGLPRVHAHCDYKRPLRFEDEVEIHLLIESVKHKSLTYQFRFYFRAAKSWRKLLRGGLPSFAFGRLLMGG